MIWIILTIFVMAVLITIKLPTNNCNQDCNQGRNCTCKGKK